MTKLLAIALLAGCSNILGIEDLAGPGNNPPADGSDAPPVGDFITITLDVRGFDGMAGEQALADTAVDFIRLPERMSLAGGRTDAMGRVVLDLATNGMPLDGYFLIEAGAINGVPYPTTSFYPLPLVASSGTSVSILTDPFLDMFAMSLGEQRSPQAAFVFIFVAQPGTDPTMAQGRPGIRIQSDPGERVAYDSPMGPDPNATQTSEQGTAYIVNAVPRPTKQLVAVEAATNRNVGTRALDVSTAQTVHFAIVPTTP